MAQSSIFWPIVEPRRAIWTSFFRLGTSTIAWTLIRPLSSYE